MNETPVYTVFGMCHGFCGHRHRTIREAEICRHRYSKKNPLSDRVVWRLAADGGRILLTRDEAIEAVRCRPA